MVQLHTGLRGGGGTAAALPAPPGRRPALRRTARHSPHHAGDRWVTPALRAPSPTAGGSHTLDSSPVPQARASRTGAPPPPVPGGCSPGPAPHAPHPAPTSPAAHLAAGSSAPQVRPCAGILPAMRSIPYVPTTHWARGSRWCRRVLVCRGVGAGWRAWLRAPTGVSLPGGWDALLARAAHEAQLPPLHLPGWAAPALPPQPCLLWCVLLLCPPAGTVPGLLSPPLCPQ